MHWLTTKVHPVLNYCQVIARTMVTKTAHAYAGGYVLDKQKLPEIVVPDLKDFKVSVLSACACPNSCRAVLTCLDCTPTCWMSMRRGRRCELNVPVEFRAAEAIRRVHRAPEEVTAKGRCAASFLCGVEPRLTARELLSARSCDGKMQTCVDLVAPSCHVAFDVSV